MRIPILLFAKQSELEGFWCVKEGIAQGEGRGGAVLRIPRGAARSISPHASHAGVEHFMEFGRLRDCCDAPGLFNAPVARARRVRT